MRSMLKLKLLVGLIMVRLVVAGIEVLLVLL
jgi:hypothetical protein